MTLLGTFQGTDITQADYANYKIRIAGRAVLFDGSKVALVHVSKHGYYMLPGGGVEDEDIPTGLAREVREELGCEITIGQEVGTAIVYFERWHNKQVDRCYLAQKDGDERATSRTDFEVEEGHQVVWADSLADAISLAENTEADDPEGKLVRARDLAFLKAAQKLLVH